ncbi:MAG: large conductance mechanosensitive channel protein MscL [Clostridia bacterium]|nr:large conductance mechanosensitive channel protein MscL [Clostridia bacterium]
MKKFFEEFKKFITRGNVLDMAVGVIVGGAFTGIVNGLSNFVLKPIINWVLALILGADGLEGAVTFLSKATTLDANGATVVDLANSIYIDWGAFISAVINFFIIAFVLFAIVKVINRIKEENEKAEAERKKKRLSKEDKKALKALGIKRSDKKAVEEYFAKKEQDRLLAEEKAKQEAEEKAKAERLANPTTEDLLKSIIGILEDKKQA